MKKTILILLAVLIAISSMAVVSANANIKFEPAKVYFDNGKLSVEGVFINNGDQNGTVDTAQLKIYLVYNDGEQILAGGNFTNVGAFVPAGGTQNWRFNITGVNYTEIGRWHVVSDIHYYW